MAKPHAMCLIAYTLLFLQITFATQLTSTRLEKAYNVMNAVSTQSWENGTKSQAVLEMENPTLSVYSSTPPFPLPDPLTSSDVSAILSIAQTTMRNRPKTNTTTKALGGSSLLNDGAAGDPASLGMAVLIANASTGNGQVNGVGYGDAATAELHYLLYDVPKSSSGAISHRKDQVQYWSDSVYMVPPFIAYYGALSNNETLLKIAYQQCSLYRDALRQPSGLWKHILGGNGTLDPGLWATGNAWAAAGMLRVLATIKRTPFASDMGSQMSDLQSWTGEILSASQGYLTSGGLLRNYIDDTTSFEDASASAMIAATGLRMSTLNLTNDFTNFSTTLLSAVSAKVNSTGYLTQVVDPEDFSSQGTHSPEGQSFVVLAYAAFNQWGAMGHPGASDKSSGLGKSSGAMRVLEARWENALGVVAVLLAGVLGLATI